MRRSGNIHAILTCSTTDIIKISDGTSTREFIMGSSSIAGIGTMPRPTSKQKQARAAMMAAKMSSSAPTAKPGTKGIKDPTSAKTEALPSNTSLLHHLRSAPTPTHNTRIVHQQLANGAIWRLFQARYSFSCGESERTQATANLLACLLQAAVAAAAGAGAGAPEESTDGVGQLAAAGVPGCKQVLDVLDVTSE
eukprot:751626-Pelagomonas_calceolata.AAC.1